ncbi:flagellin [Methylotenera sp.]|uniref:flagellin N-terminal helical domain-containing protein n=1 Tax=Methylotenera sp. TaxID=2051956 RepID=UPI002722E24A|nr:flagellin [Methylotenera sp.]MDO9204330.1 flagellin [Methylotenera sp.]MDP1524160.1 flagellin [Methylotenera sp.]MDP2071364.1 flagellin [Methylotenera sp.]MDP2229829.1 flagellin [Methylotenera sp.]MDP3005325.1 flagellin [Methylotenera sp.]
MASVINTNIASLNTQRNLSASQAGLNTSLQRLSSGLRINSGKDDASGLAIATKMDSQIRGMNVAIRNSNDAISFAQTADGGLSKVTDSLQRMRELAVQGANGTTDNASLAAEFGQLQEEIVRVSANTLFNGVNTLGSVAAAGVAFQVGANNTANDSVTVTGVDLSAGDTAAAAAATILVDTAANSKLAIEAIDAAIIEVNDARATFGAVQNRFESIVSNLQVSAENQSAAKSRIMDADFAAESANLTRGQILQQAGTAMLAQANSLPNGVLALLRG